MIYAILGASVLVIAAVLFYTYKLQLAIQCEREKLLDRVQSQNLLEYKSLVEPQETKEIEDKPKYEFV